MLVTAMFLSPWVAQALEYRAELSAAWWQYEERIDAFIPGLAPLDSNANGLSVQPRLQVIFGDPWRWHVGVSGLLPVLDADEHWAGPGFSQSNHLAVLQWEAEAALLRQWGLIDLGVYAIYRWHRQQRSSFVVNGVPRLLPNEPVRELVQSDWIGVQVEKRFILSESEALLRFKAGLPVWARANNDLLGAFTGNGGYQAAVDAQWQLGSRDGLDISLGIGYHISMLEGEMRADGAIWPDNRWQSVAFTILGKW